MSEGRAMDGAAVAELEYLRLRCDILEQVDRDMFGRGLAAGAACGRADEAFAASRNVWRWSVLLGVLARRDRDALVRWGEEAEAVRSWMESEDFAALPERVREQAERDWRAGSGSGASASPPGEIR